MSSAHNVGGRTVVFRGLAILLALAGFLVILAATGFLERSGPASAQGEGPVLLVYSEEDFGGRCLVVTGSLVDLPKEELEDGSSFDWNDNVRSLRVLSGTWRLCQHGRLNTVLDDLQFTESQIAEKARATGWSALVSAGPGGPSEHPSASGWGWAQDISSIDLLSGEPLPDWARRALPGR